MEEQELDLEELLRIIKEEKLKSLVAKPDKNKKRTLEDKESASIERAKIYLSNVFGIDCALFNTYDLQFVADGFNNYESGNFQFLNKHTTEKPIYLWDLMSLSLNYSENKNNVEKSKDKVNERIVLKEEKPVKSSKHVNASNKKAASGKGSTTKPEEVALSKPPNYSYGPFDPSIEYSLRNLLIQGISFSEIAKLKHLKLSTLKKKISKDNLINCVTAPDKSRKETLEVDSEFAKARLRFYVRNNLKGSRLIYGYIFDFVTSDINDFSDKNILVIANNPQGRSKNRTRKGLLFDEFKRNTDLVNKEKLISFTPWKVRKIKTLIKEGRNFSYILERLDMSEKTCRNYVNEYNLHRLIIPPTKDNEETLETDVELANFRARLYLKALFEKNNINDVDFSRERIVFFDNDINNYELNNLVLVSVKSKNLSNAKKISDYF